MSGAQDTAATATDDSALRAAGSMQAPPDADGRDGERGEGSAPAVLFVGTSLTAGYGLQHEEAYPALIQRRIDSLGLNYHVVNAGVSGETSADARRRIGWLLRGQRADIVVIETGANDGLRGLSVDTLRANVGAIIDSVRAVRPQAEILLVAMEAPPNLGSRYTAEFREVYPEVASEKGVVLVPFLLAGVAGIPSLNQQDGIHPNARGERIVAENVWRTLRDALVPVRPEG
ncbi:MAG TPA: arylesterase [Gemmatimonadaceae bacterium]|nr:arylesterase [Gemmatimonadaceae bacterium]